MISFSSNAFTSDLAVFDGIKSEMDGGKRSTSKTLWGNYVPADALPCVSASYKLREAGNSLY